MTGGARAAPFPFEPSIHTAPFAIAEQRRRAIIVLLKAPDGMALPRRLALSLRMVRHDLVNKVVSVPQNSFTPPLRAGAFFD